MSKFIAAMDHSGGSSPGVLERYGYPNAHELPHEVVMDDIHLMRLRMASSPDFVKENIWAAILYKDTVERGMVPVLHEKGIQAYLKVDSGCEEDGSLKDFDVAGMIDYALENNCTGTKMRSIVKDEQNLDAILSQQFELAQQIYRAGLMPIVEPEIPIDHPMKSNYEHKLRDELAERLDAFIGKCILKLTLPDQDNFYSSIMKHNNVYKVVGLSGGYTTAQACRRLKCQAGMSASFSRALSEGLFITQSDDEFNTQLSSNISVIVQAGIGNE